MASRALRFCRPLVRQISRNNGNVRARACSTIAPSAAGFNDYEAERKDFRLEVPPTFNFALTTIDGWAAKEASGAWDKKTPAFWWVGEDGSEVKWSFSELSEHSKRVASILTGPCGFVPGDRLMVMLPKIPEWWLLALGAWRSGIVLLPATLQLTANDVSKRLSASGAKGIVTNTASVDKVESVLKDFPSVKAKIVVSDTAQRSLHDTSSHSPAGWLDFQGAFNTTPVYDKERSTKSSDPMTIFFTSGTTGAPKMALHTQGSYGAAHYLSGRFFMDQTPHDIMWITADTGWAKCSWTVAPWMLGACVFVHEQPKFDPEQTVQILNRYPITTFCGPPTAYRMMTQVNLQASPWKHQRHFISGGEPLNPEVTDVWLDGTGQYIREGHGQTEAVVMAATYRCIPIRPGALGKPCPGMDTRIVDEDGNESAVGVEGEVALKVKPHRPAGLFVEYVDEPERTARAFRGDYYLTGDRGYQDEDGYLWFMGRSDDVIITSGYRIGPFEVESALQEHPAVAESAVVSSPDETRGEVVKAFVLLTSNAALAEDKKALARDIQDHVKRTTAPYKYPRQIEFVSELPKTVSGKIRRIELREKEWAKIKKKK